MVRTSEIYESIAAHYGDNCMNRRQICEWMETFKGGRTSFIDDELLISAGIEVKEQMNQIIRKNR
jgi:hypothetical protein